jgi:cellulose synthase/poly-beta-1,6-N-acetylglucosamine synthase-like glycosyltransferase
MNFYLLFFYALSAPLFAYCCAVIAMTLALLVKVARRKGLPAVDTEDINDAINYGAPGVSVVIPFRNEERNLNGLLASIDRQDYGGMMEVVLVNDGSTDGGAGVIEKFAPDNRRLRIRTIELLPAADTRLTSKQQALDLGVDRASYRLILFTDADMILEPTWVGSMVNSHLSTGAGLVFGHTAIVGGGHRQPAVGRRGLFAVLESYQLEYLFSFACAFSRLNLTGSCMGNNILVTKEAYAACGGQRGVGYSIVEDRALLGLMRKKGFKAAAQEPFTVTAWTYPSQSTGRFVNQMLRWAAGGLRPGGGLFAAGLLLLTQNVVFMLSMIGTLPPALTLLSAANFMLTWAFLSISFHKNRSPASKFLYPLYYVFMMVETAVFVPLMLFKRRIDWKDRKV